MDVRDKTLVVTGAGRGIGRALALHFARSGAQLALLDTNATDLEETRAALHARKARARAAMSPTSRAKRASSPPSPRSPPISAASMA